METKKNALSSFELRVLRKIAASPLSSFDGGDARVGSLSVPASVIARLRRLGLVERAGAGVRASDAGAAHLRRVAAAKPSAGRRGAAGYADQHRAVARQIREVEGVRRTVSVNLAESPLGWLARRRGRDGRPLISAAQVEAGERLRSDFELAGMTPRLVRGYDASPVSGGRRSAPASPDPTGAQIDARRRLDAAVAAAGPGLSDVLIRVCCFLEGLEEAERQLGWPTRSAKVVLSIALDRLADHYAGQKKKGARRRPNGKGMPARVRL